MDRRKALALLALGAAGCGTQAAQPAGPSPASSLDAEDGALTASKNDRVAKCVKKFIKAMEA